MQSRLADETGYERWQTSKIVYVGGSLTVHDPFFFCSQLSLNRFKMRRLLLVNKNKIIIGKLLNVVHRHVLN